MSEEIEKYGAPPFLLLPENEKRILKVPHISSDYPFDKPAKLEVLSDNSGVVLLDATDIRGTTDGSPSYKKFICYSFAEGKQLMTSYLAYTFEGPVVVETWDKEKKYLLENIDMFHVDITPDRFPDNVIKKHLERINGKKSMVEGLKDFAEKSFIDMYNNLPAFYCVWTGKN